MSIQQFNPDKPKVSTRRMRKQYGRDSVEGKRAKEHELNRGKQAEALSLENIDKDLRRG